MGGASPAMLVSRKRHGSVTKLATLRLTTASIAECTGVPARHGYGEMDRQRRRPGALHLLDLLQLSVSLGNAFSHQPLAGSEPI